MKLQIVQTVAIVPIAPAITAMGILVNNTIHSRMLSKENVEIAMSILRAHEVGSNDKQDKELRNWAVDVLEHGSPVPINGELRNSIVSRDVVFPHPQPVASEIPPYRDSEDAAHCGDHLLSSDINSPIMEGMQLAAVVPATDGSKTLATDTSGIETPSCAALSSQSLASVGQPPMLTAPARRCAAGDRASCSRDRTGSEDSEDGRLASPRQYGSVHASSSDAVCAMHSRSLMNQDYHVSYLSSDSSSPPDV